MKLISILSFLMMTTAHAGPLTASPLPACDNGVQFLFTEEQRKAIAFAQDNAEDLVIRGASIVFLGNSYPLEKDLYAKSPKDGVSLSMRVFPSVEFRFKRGILASAKSDLIEYTTDFSTPREYRHTGCNCDVVRDDYEWFGSIKSLETGKTHEFQRCWFGALGKRA